MEEIETIVLQYNTIIMLSTQMQRSDKSLFFYHMLLFLHNQRTREEDGLLTVAVAAAAAKAVEAALTCLVAAEAAQCSEDACIEAAPLLAALLAVLVVGHALRLRGVIHLFFPSL
uniref:Uncharacterized protein n=1 Tax=Arundo donax TaxID=35708 RepID=A0A0A8YSH2_ARUDO